MLSVELVLQKTKVDNLAQVKNLNLWGSELEDVSIVKQMPNLQVLALSVNKISSLAEIGQCPSLTELYLRKNNVRNLGEVKHLGNLPHLTTLWLCDNPCSSHPLYRLFTIRCCPALRQFDNEEVTAQERSKAGQLTQAEMDDIVAQRGRHAPRREPPPPNAAPPAPSAAPSANLGAANDSGNRRSSRPTSNEAVATAGHSGPNSGVPSAADSSGRNHASRQTQKSILSAILTLLKELNTDTLQYLHEEVGDQLQRKRAGVS